MPFLCAAHRRGPSKYFMKGVLYLSTFGKFYLVYSLPGEFIVDTNLLKCLLNPAAGNPGKPRLPTLAWPQSLFSVTPTDVKRNTSGERWSGSLHFERTVTGLKFLWQLATHNESSVKTWVSGECPRREKKKTWSRAGSRISLEGKKMLPGKPRRPG